MRGCIQWSLLQQVHFSEELTCSICLQCMVHPYVLNCTNPPHVFGYHCIKEWRKQGEKGKTCPLCRNPYTQMAPQTDLFQKVSTYQVKCLHCKQIPLAINFSQHLRQCQGYISKKKSELSQIVAEQLSILDKEITNHLKEVHEKIYTQHVKGWSWLAWDQRDWKWWWWANNPWWENKPCVKCNQLWHKYEDQMDKLERQRVSIIAQLDLEPPK